jgi:hypothetical protein
MVESLIFLLVVIIVILSLGYSWYHTRTWERLASDLGITYLGWGHQFRLVFGHFSILDDYGWEGTNHQCQGDYRGAEVTLGLQICRSRSSNGRRSYKRTVFALRDPQLQSPHFLLRSENLLLDSLGSLLGGQDIDFDEDPTFSRNFVLQGSDPDATAKLFSDHKVRAAFMTLKKSSFKLEAEGDTIVVRCKRSLFLRQIRPFLDCLVEIRDALRTPIETPTKAANAYQSQIEPAFQPDISDWAIALQRKQPEHVADSRWSQPQLAQVIRRYLKTKNYAKAEEMIALHIELFEEDRFDMQVTIIKIWLQGQRPRHALRYIKKLFPTCLSNEDKQQLQKLGSYAKKQIDSGVSDHEVR